MSRCGIFVEAGVASLTRMLPKGRRVFNIPVNKTFYPGNPGHFSFGLVHVKSVFLRLECLRRVFWIQIFFF